MEGKNFLRTEITSSATTEFFFDLQRFNPNLVTIVGGTSYASLSLAINNVGSGSTIKFLNNISISSPITISDKNFALDFDSYKLELSSSDTSNAAFIVSSGSLSFSNADKMIDGLGNVLGIGIANNGATVKVKNGETYEDYSNKAQAKIMTNASDTIPTYFNVFGNAMKQLDDTEILTAIATDAVQDGVLKYEGSGQDEKLKSFTLGGISNTTGISITAGTAYNFSLSAANFATNGASIMSSGKYTFKLSGPSVAANRNIFTGSSGNDIIESSIPYLKINGLGGADSISISGASSTIDAGAGADSIFSFAKYVSINSGADNDYISIAAGGDNSTIDASGGNDSIVSFAKYVFVDSGANDDHISISGASSTVDAGGGDDKISIGGGGSYASIFGGGGNDYIISGGSFASIFGGTGNDIISVSGASSVLDGGGGNDSLNVTGRTGNAKFTFIYNGGADSISGYSSIDNISLSGVKAITNGNNFEINASASSATFRFDNSNSLTFTDTKETTFSFKIDGETYNYSASTIELADKSVTLTSGYSANTYSTSNFASINAAEVTVPAFKITYNGSASSYIIGSDEAAMSILGGAQNDTLIAGKAGASLYGGGGSNSLVGGVGEDLFVYSGGNDSISGYNIKKDIIGLSGISALTDPSKVESLGSGLKLTFGGTSILTFDDDKGYIKSGGSTYYYKQNFVMMNDEAVSLGGQETLFSANSADYKSVATINASKVTTGIRILGNDIDNLIIGSSSAASISILNGNAGNDSLVAGTAGAILNGGEGNDSLVGGNGADTFIFNGGSDSIRGYNFSNRDLVSLTSAFAPEKIANVSVSGTDLILEFDGENKLTFESGSTSSISLASEGKGTINYYTLTKDYILQDNSSITLTSNYAGTSFIASGTSYASILTIDASAVTRIGGISIAGNDKANTIIGSKQGGSIDGGAGTDYIDVTDRDNSDGIKFTFRYTSGKDTVEGFNSQKDKLTILDASTITGTKSSKGKLTFTFSGKNNSLVLKSDDSIGRVSLTGGGYITRDGVVTLGGTSSLKLFSNASGKIDLTEESLYGGSSIASINASDVKEQSITVVGSSLVSNFNFAKNGKKDTFVYGGGNVSITGYEDGKDKINIGTGSITGFSIGADSLVAVSVSGFGSDVGVISLTGAAGKEVLVQDSANKTSKKIFAAGNILYDKAINKTPVSATILGGSSSFAVGTQIAGLNVPNSIKKISVGSGVSDISITAGDSNNTTVNASAADGVTLIGGKKNDKFIGSENNADVFVYGKVDVNSAGKDVIEDFVSANDVVSLGGFSMADIKKVNASTTSVKLIFNENNTLTIKGKKGTLDKIKILDVGAASEKEYTFKKNAIILDEQASLTSEASGSFKLDKIGVNYVDAKNVAKKNLTLTGTTNDDTIYSGGTKANLQGGGGDDLLVGGNGADTFVYLKGKEGDVTIQKFDFAKDKLKIASSTIDKIESISGGGVQFSLTDGKKDSSPIASFKVASSVSRSSESTIDPNKIAIKANNTYYWFAKEHMDETETVTVKGDSAESKTVTLASAEAGDLITSSSVTKSQFTALGYSIIDLGYSTNLVSSGVAIKFKDAKPNDTPSNS